MFRRVHRVKAVLQFLRERAPHYGPLARDDLHNCRDEIVGTELLSVSPWLVSTIDQGWTPAMSIAPMENASAAAAVCAFARASSTCVSPWTTAFSSVARSV
jgi:hypothetical protein